MWTAARLWMFSFSDLLLPEQPVSDVPRAATQRTIRTPRKSPDALLSALRQRGS